MKYLDNYLPRWQNTLYRKTKTGKIQTWRVWTIDNVVHTEYGQQDGKKQQASKIIEGKNLGKSNETTPSEQAIRKAKSMFEHRLDSKYSATVTEADEPVFLPQLAHDFDKAKAKVKYPVGIQPKLDGVRCLAYWVETDEGDRIELLSRGGKEYAVPHIAEEVSKIIPEGYVFDGELYIHGESLQNINKLVKKHREGPDGSERLEYHVYDGFWMGEEVIPWEDRDSELNDLVVHSVSGKELAGKVKYVESSNANSEDEVRLQLEEFIKNGYEGAIVRVLDAPYLLGHRSSGLLKVKNFKDAEFEITGHYYGTGRAAEAVVWKCKQEEGLEFSVVPKGTIEQREKWGRTALSYYGKQLKVKFWNRTDDNIPQFPIGVCIRLEEDL